MNTNKGPAVPELRDYDEKIQNTAQQSIWFPLILVGIGIVIILQVGSIGLSIAMWSDPEPSDHSVGHLESAEVVDESTTDEPSMVTTSSPSVATTVATATTATTTDTSNAPTFTYVVEVSDILEPKDLTVPELSTVSFEFKSAGHNVWSADSESMRSVSSQDVVNPRNTHWTTGYLTTSASFTTADGLEGSITVEPLPDVVWAERIVDLSIDSVGMVKTAYEALEFCSIKKYTATMVDINELNDVWELIDWGSIPDAQMAIKLKKHLMDMVDISKDMLELFTAVTGVEYSAAQIEKGGNSEVSLMAALDSVDPYFAYHELGELIEHVPKLMGAKQIKMETETLGDAYNRMKTEYLKDPTKVQWTLDIPMYAREYDDVDKYGLMLDSVEDFAKGAGYSLAAKAVCEELKASPKFAHVIGVFNNYFEPKDLVVPELSTLHFDFQTPGHNVWDYENEWMRSVETVDDLNARGTQWSTTYLTESSSYVCVPHELIGHVGSVTVTRLPDEVWAERIVDISINSVGMVKTAYEALEFCTTTTYTATVVDINELNGVWMLIDWESIPDAQMATKLKAHLMDMVVISKDMLELFTAFTGIEYSAAQIEKGGNSEVSLMAALDSVDPYFFYHELGELIEHVPKLMGAKHIKTETETLAEAYNRMKTEYLKDPTKVQWTLNVPMYAREYDDVDKYGLMLDSLEDFAKGAGYSLAAKAAICDQ